MQLTPFSKATVDPIPKSLVAAEESLDAQDTINLAECSA